MYIESLDNKSFYQYLGIVLAIILVLVSLVTFNFYRTVWYWQERNEVINEQREEVRELLTKAKQVKLLQTDAGRMIEQDEDFKIRDYFETLLQQLQIPRASVVEINITPVEHDAATREDILNAKLTDLDMKQLSELLEAIEQNKRVYIKELDIVKSKRKPRSLEVNITFATLNKITGT